MKNSMVMTKYFKLMRVCELCPPLSINTYFFLSKIKGADFLLPFALNVLFVYYKRIVYICKCTRSYIKFTNDSN